jgi:hypothetical protein
MSNRDEMKQQIIQNGSGKCMFILVSENSLDILSKAICEGVDKVKSGIFRMFRLQLKVF